MKKRNASGTPFHCFDIHMPNHSPPTDMKATCHVRKPSVRPAIAYALAARNAVSPARRARSRRTPPSQHNTAVSVSIEMMPR